MSFPLYCSVAPQGRHVSYCQPVNGRLTCHFCGLSALRRDWS